MPGRQGYLGPDSSSGLRSQPEEASRLAEWASGKAVYVVLAEGGDSMRVLGRDQPVVEAGVLTKRANNKVGGVGKSDRIVAEDEIRLGKPLRPNCPVEPARRRIVEVPIG